MKEITKKDLEGYGTSSGAVLRMVEDVVIPKINELIEAQSKTTTKKTTTKK